MQSRILELKHMNKHEIAKTQKSDTKSFWTHEAANHLLCTISQIVPGLKLKNIPTFKD